VQSGEWVGSTLFTTNVPFQGKGGRLVHAKEPERIRMYYLKESENQLQVRLILQF
jgi:hypothetical protein